MSGIFLPQCEAGEAAESWTPDTRWGSDGCVDAFWSGAEDGSRELEIQELGQRVADAFDDENDWPDYRRWEIEDVIRHRAQRRGA